MILSCQNISKSFGTDEILKNVSFHIEENEKAAVVGINGAGKSTLLKIIMKQYHSEDFEFGTKVIPVTTVFKMVVDDMTGKRRKNNIKKKS